MKQKDSKRSRQAIETREKLFNAAMALAEEKGLDGFTIDDIQKRTGCSRGLFYNYFQSINDIISEIVLEKDSHYQIIRDEYLGDTRGAERILLFIQYAARLNCMEKEREPIRVHYVNMLKNKTLSTRTHDSSRWIYSILSEALKECAEDDLLLPDLDTHQAINDIKVILRGTVFESLLEEDNFQEDTVASQAVRLVSAYLSSILKPDVCISVPTSVRPLDASSFHCPLSASSRESE